MSCGEIVVNCGALGVYTLDKLLLMAITPAVRLQHVRIFPNNATSVIEEQCWTARQDRVYPAQGWIR